MRGFVLVLGVLLFTFSFAQPPPLMNYQGRLLTKEGTPVADGVYSISFRIYDAAEGGEMLWEEVHESVQVKGGFFHVLLGSINPLSSSLFNAPDRWFEVIVEGEQLQPRSRIATFPYAFNADTVDGKHAADLGDGHSLHASDGDPKDVVYVDNNGNVGIGTTSPNYKVSIQASGNDYYLSLSENEPGGADGFEFQIAPGGGTAKTRIGYLRGNFGSSSGFYIYNERNAPIRFGTNNIERMRITNTGNVGIGTTEPQYKLDVEGYVQAHGYYTGDIVFQKDGNKLWRMFEDEDGLYLENLRTGEVYRFVLEKVKK